MAISCSQPPQGQVRWSLRMLADKLVELEYVDSISHETIRKTLKKKRIKALEKRAMGNSTRTEWRFCCTNGIGA